MPAFYGPSRTSAAQLTDALPTQGDLGAAAQELLAVVRLLSTERRLRRALTDAGTSADARGGVVDQLLGSQLDATALGVVRDAVRRRWSESLDLLRALEVAAAQLSFAAAERDGELDRVEDDLFRFGRALDSDGRLGQVLTEQSVPVDRRLGVLHDLVSDQASPVTVRLLESLVAVPRGGGMAAAVDELSDLAAARRQRLFAEVTVAQSLTGEQTGRFRDVLGRLYQRAVEVHEVIDPRVLGGARVTIGDDVIDGTVLRRLASAHQQFEG